MLQISVESDINKALNTLDGVLSPRALSFVTMNTLNGSAFAALRKLRTDTPKFLDRPTPRTINSSKVLKATQQKMEAQIVYKDGEITGRGTAGEYLKPVTFGGERRHKRFEGALLRAKLMPPGLFAVPTDDVGKDQYGNVRGGLYTRILSTLQANPDTQQNKYLKSLRRQSTLKLLKKYAKQQLKGNRAAVQRNRERARLNAARYFVVSAGVNDKGLSPGIYERLNTKGGKQNSKLTKLFSFVPSVSYKAQYPFARILADAVRAVFPQSLADAIKREFDRLAR